ncbi:MAG: hypothetical protein ACE5E5_08190 [Phycisphaerae bacterium]
MNQEKGRLQDTIEVGPISHPDLRIRLLKALGAAGFDFKRSAYKEGARFTRFVTKTEKLRRDENDEADNPPEHVSEITKRLWAGVWKEGEKIVEGLKKFDRAS